MAEIYRTFRILESSMLYYPQANLKNAMKNITIYSTPTCHFCKLAKDYMTAHNIAFTAYDVASDLEKRKEMVDKSGQLGVPVIDIGGKILVGFDEAEFTAAFA